MMKQQFYLPTQVVMETDCVRKNAGLLAGMGRKALVVTGARSAKANGSLADVTEALRETGRELELFDRVEPNPTVDCIYAGAAAAKSAGCDFVIAIGGGSPMDAGKGIALLAAQDIPEEKIFDGGYEKRLPLCCIPTTAGTGSECTQYAILTNDRAKTKTSLASPVLFPDLALLDSAYMKGLGHRTMVNTVIDSISHSLEGCLSVKSSFVSDALAMRALELAGLCLPRLQTDSLTSGELTALMTASTLGGMVIAQTGTTAVHAMGYSLTYFKHIDHGRANGLLLGAFLRLIKPKCPGRISRILSALGFEELEGFTAALDALLGERENISEAELSEFADAAIKAGNIKNCLVAPDREDLMQVYLASFKR